MQRGTSVTESYQLQFSLADAEPLAENPDYLSTQLITYIGNKRALAPYVQKAMELVRTRVGGRRLACLDLFAGSGVIARLLKQHSSAIMANDLEGYSAMVSKCYLSNRDEVPVDIIDGIVRSLNAEADAGADVGGFIRKLYSPRDDRAIEPGERVFYTVDNARRIDLFATRIAELPDSLKPFLLGPLLARASAHANTSGVFKGFYKDRATGVGKFGGTGADALKRILEPIRLEVPVLSNFNCESVVYQEDANAIVGDLPSLDLVYIDPPYNQHPYGSNYFMLNLINNYQEPENCSPVSGIPTNWNRSDYNVKQRSRQLLRDLLQRLPARFILLSFNAEGFIRIAELRDDMSNLGRVDEIVIRYNTFRGSRNLRARTIHVNEHLFLLDRNG